MSRLFASLYDRISAGYEAKVMGPRRRQLLADVGGTVLELGAGTGANLAHYAPDLDLVLTEPDPHMRRRLGDRAELGGLSAQIVDAPAEQLPVDDASVDAVVATLVFCTVADPEVALAEVRRVLRPDGRLLFLEHVRSAEPSIARWQDRLAPVTRRISGGCHPNRDTVAALRAAGFQTDDLVEHPTDKLAERLQPIVQGAATVADPRPAATAGNATAG